MRRLVILFNNIYKLGGIVLVSLLICIVTCVPSFAAKEEPNVDEPFIGPTNWGATGLMEIPTARIMKEDTYRLGAGQVYPYRYYYLAMSPLKFMEMDGRVTEVIGVPGFANQDTGYGNFKDKAMDFKFRILGEGKWTPAFALGINDPQGTRVYPSQYLVASKQIYPFDFTVGFGNGRYGKTPLTATGNGFAAEIFTDTRQWLKDAQLFWGIQFSPSEKFSLMMEYSPIRYDKQTLDPAQPVYFQRPVSQKFNFGLRWKPFKWTEIDVSYQRGNEFGLSLSTVFNMGKPFIPIHDTPYTEKKVYTTEPIEKRLERALSESGFSDIGITIEPDGVRIEAQNNKYYYAPRALSVVLRLVRLITPPRLRNIEIILTQNGIPMTQYTALRDDLDELYREKLTRDEFSYLSKLRTDVYRKPDVDITHRKWVDFGLKPAFETVVNQPSQFFEYRAGVSGWMNIHPWQGASLIGGVGYYPLNDITNSVAPMPNPVRSDIIFYREKKTNVERVMAEQIFKAGHEVWGKLAGGYLEVEYAGVDGEVAMPLKGGRFMVGLGGSALRKRDPNNTFGILQPGDDVRSLYWTSFLNTRLNVPEYNLWFEVKTGRFLAGDYGSVLTVGKNINGLLLYAWYSFTNTNIFTDQYNRGYHDKGVGLSLPLRLFDGTDSKTAYTYAISPWTRDVAQDIDHFTRLFDYIGRNLKVYWDKDEKQMKFE